VSDVEERIGRLSPEKRALLERQLLLRATDSSADVIPRRTGSGPCPLSFPQRRLWFLEQLAPGQPTYNAALAMRVRGALDLDRLERGVRAVIARHEALRTVFGVRELEPVQLLLEDWSFSIDRRDLRGVASTDREREMLRQAREEARRPFDLDADLMLRVTSLRVAEDEHVLVFIEHHIAFDGWSDGQLFRELAALYEAEGGEPELDPLPIQYADWSAWQLERMSGPELERLLRFWGDVLRGAPPLLELPLDRPRPPVQSFAGAHDPLVPLPLAGAVRALAQDEGATPFMVLLAAFAAALHRWSGAEDVVIGSPVANRDHVQLEHLIGFFSNTFVLRVRPDSHMTLRELVRECRSVALDAYEHRELPFEKLVEHVRPPRDPRVNPIFQVNFRAQSRPPAVLTLHNLEVEPLLLDLGFSRFDLALDCQLDGERITGYLEYNSALFTEATIRTLGVRMSRLLEDGLARPDVPLGELAWASTAPGIRGRRST
jgi:hypothetical protein